MRHPKAAERPADLTTSVQEAHARLAALINAYHEIIRRSPPRRPSWWGFVSYFFLDRHDVLGHSWTLWRLENEIRTFGEPRVHFALNCGAVSCPPIREYDPKNLDHHLDVATRTYLSSDQAVRIDVRQRTVYLSPLFRWYRKEFGAPLRFISRYLSPEQLDRLQQVGPSPRIRYLPWDWSPVTP